MLLIVVASGGILVLLVLLVALSLLLLHLSLSFCGLRQTHLTVEESVILTETLKHFALQNSRARRERYTHTSKSESEKKKLDVRFLSRGFLSLSCAYILKKYTHTHTQNNRFLEERR